MAKLKTRFICQSCGGEQPRWLGKCPECDAWNALVEEAVGPVPAPTPRASRLGRPVSITEVPTDAEERMPTGFPELDRVLGGGIVPGSLVLMGGEPGIGKSTLLLQVADSLARTGRQVLYLSGEESARQIRTRAQRLGALHPGIRILAETDLDLLSGAIQAEKPDWAVIDSIQAIQDPDLGSAAGSVSQVRGATSVLMRLAKEQGIALCIVGHVTKEGTLAGPRVLEHMVDTVLHFEGERFKSYRLIRAVKNRYGSTHEVGIFEMAAGGLREVSNPSALFLAERDSEATGSVVVPTMEGTRPILVEIQALVAPSALASPRRAATGLELNRVVQVLAVLEKRMGLNLGKHDVYVNVVGGMRIDEPAADMAIALAAASSLRDTAMPSGLVAVGEIGLNGEVRTVHALEQRLREAAKLGFSRAIAPQHSLGKGFSAPRGIAIQGATRLVDVMAMLAT